MILSFLQFMLMSSLRGEVLDITTLRRMDRPDDIVCITGTNALGYPLKGPNGTVIEGAQEAAALGRCLVELGLPCEWEADGWEVRPIVGQIRFPAFAQPDELPLQSWTAVSPDAVLMPRDTLRVRVRATTAGEGEGGRGSGAPEKAYLLLASGVDLEAAEVLAVEIARGGGGGGRGGDGGEALLRCGRAAAVPARNRRLRSLLPGAKPLDCAQRANPADYLPLVWAADPDAEVELVVSTEGGKLRLWSYNNNNESSGDSEKLLLSRPLQLDFSPLYIAAVSHGRDTQWMLLLDAPALMQTRSGASRLRSPSLRRAALPPTPPLPAAPTAHPRAVCVSFFAFLRPGTGARLTLHAARGESGGSGGGENGSSRIVAELRGAEEAGSSKEGSAVDGHWQLHRIVVELQGENDDNVDEYLELHAHADDVGAVALHSIMGCNPWGSTEAVRVHIPEGEFESESNINQFVCESALKPLYKSGTCGFCENGGKCLEGTGECACRPGFIGNYCQEGCGEGQWGADCSSHCANRGCRYLLLCGAHGSLCGCAPGLFGNECNQACVPGSYGVDCALLCGHCANAAPCDRFDGRCPRGCASGFLPPRCQHPYTYLIKPPVIENVSFDTAIVSFRMDHHFLAGAGHPQFYQIIYWVEGRRAPLREPPRLLPRGGRHMSHLLEGLEPGREHRVAVALIDRDGGQPPETVTYRSRTFMTRCEVPQHPIYHLSLVDVKRNSFILSWRFKANSNVACRATAFEVLLWEGGRHFSYASTADSLLEVGDLHPGDEYAVRVRALTRAGPAPPSHHITVITNPREPSTVRDVDFEQTSFTELLIKWKPPLHSGNRITNYRVIYKCLRLLACPATSGCPIDAADLVTASSEAVAQRGDHLSVVLRRLRPHAQYEVAVVAVQEDGQQSPPTRITALTRHAVPTVAPRPAPQAVTRHDTSRLTVSWLPPADCAHLNGYPVGYLYRVLRVGPPPVEVFVNNVTHPPVLIFGLRIFTNYEVHVHQLVTGGLYSNQHKLVIEIQTDIVSPQVRELKVKEISSTSLKLQWLYPENFNHQYIQYFVVSYECQQYLACPEQYSCGSKVHRKTNDSELTIYELIPHAEYIFRVAAFTGTIGLSTSFTVFTAAAEPLVSPMRHPESTPARGDTWLTVRWRPPSDCTRLRGPLAGYVLRLLHNASVVQEEFVDVAIAPGADTIANITDLQPATAYVVSVAAVTSNGFGARLVSNVTLDLHVFTLPPETKLLPTPKPLTEMEDTDVSLGEDIISEQIFMKLPLPLPT